MLIGKGGGKVKERVESASKDTFIIVKDSVARKKFLKDNTYEERIGEVSDTHEFLVKELVRHLYYDGYEAGEMSTAIELIFTTVEKLSGY